MTDTKESNMGLEVIDYQDIAKYVDCANNLAISLNNDLSKGPKVSTNTIIALTKFAEAAFAVKIFTDMCQADLNKIN